MDCNDARVHLLDRSRGLLDATVRSELEAHLATCPECRYEEAADGALSSLLKERLPRRRAPASLRRALQERWLPAPRRPTPALRTLAALALGAALVGLPTLAWRARTADPSMVAEAVNDHLRVLYSQRPLEVESGGIHQVKPWFEGKLDFAPVVAFAGDDEFPFRGGSSATSWIERRPRSSSNGGCMSSPCSSSRPRGCAGRHWGREPSGAPAALSKRREGSTFFCGARATSGTPSCPIRTKRT